MKAFHCLKAAINFSIIGICGCIYWIYPWVYERGRTSHWFFQSKAHWSSHLPPLSACVSSDFLGVLSKQRGLQRAAYHHLLALYSPWQHLRPNIWVEISQISSAEKLAQRAVWTLSRERWDGAETEAVTPLVALTLGCTLAGWWEQQLLLQCYTTVLAIQVRLTKFINIKSALREEKRKKRNTGQWEAERASQESIYEPVGCLQLQTIIKDAGCGGFLTSRYANSTAETAGTGV